jgi:hypothetical protein
LTKLGSVTATATELNTLYQATAGNAVASKALVVNSSKDISGLNVVTAATLKGTTLFLGGAQVGSTATELNKLQGATVTTADLNKLASVTATATELNKLQGAIVTTADLTKLGSVTATALELNTLNQTTAGTALASKALVVDSSRDISGLNVVTAATLKGTTLTLGGTPVSATATELNTLYQTTAGTAVASKALVVDSSRDISGLNVVTAATLKVTGASTLASLNVTGASTLTKISVTSDASFSGSRVDICGNLFANSLAVNNATTVGGTLNVTGASTLTKISVTSDASFSGSRVDICGNLFANSLAVNNATTVGGTLNVTGASTLNDKLLVTKDVSLNSKLFVDKDVSFNTRLSVGYDSSFNRNVDICGNLVIYGNLSVFQQKTTSIINTSINNYEIITTKDISINGNLVVTNKTYTNTIAPIASTNDITFDSTTSIIVPKGGNYSGSATAGGLRYNTTNNAFEGYSNNAWTSLGGVISNSKNVKVTAHDTSGVQIFATSVAGYTANGNLSPEVMRIDLSGNVGIGKINPTATLDVSGSFNITYSAPTPIAESVAPAVTIQMDTSGSSTYSRWQHSSQLEIRSKTYVSNNPLAFNSLALAMSLDGVGIIQGKTYGVGYNTIALNPVNGTVCIAKTSANTAYKLDVNGDVQALSYNATSDYRIKDNVLSLPDCSFVVDPLRPVYYRNKLTNKQDVGLIAHEVQEHFPFLVTGEKDGEHNQSVNYTGFIGLLIHEIQQLKLRVSELEKINRSPN